MSSATLVRMRRILAVLLLTLPLASAAATLPVRGDLEMDAPPAVTGHVAFASPRMTLDATRAVLAGEAWTLTWESARGERVEASWQATDVGHPTRGQKESRTEPLAFGPGRLDRATCEARCYFLVLSDMEDDLVLTGASDGPLRQVDAGRGYCPEFCKDVPGTYSRVVPPTAFALAGPNASLRDAKATGAGRLVLFFAHAEATVALDDGPRTLSAREHETFSVGAPGVPVFREYENSYVRLVLDGATLETPTGTAAELFAESPRVDFDGALSTPAATGALSVGGTKRALDHESVALDGAGTVRLDAAPPGILADAPLRATLDADATSVRVAGALIEPSVMASTGAKATVGVVGALAILLVVAKLAAPFYTRIQPASVLAHPSRARLLDLVKLRSSSTMRELAEATGLARVVVMYHLRVLQRHGLVGRVTSGRVLAFFATTRPLQATDAQDLALLATEARRRVASLVAGEPLTQDEVAARAGVSRRLACHHLLRLEGAGLVRRSPGRPHRYEPTPRLVSALRKLDAQ